MTYKRRLDANEQVRRLEKKVCSSRLAEEHPDAGRGRRSSTGAVQKPHKGDEDAPFDCAGRGSGPPSRPLSSNPELGLRPHAWPRSRPRFSRQIASKAGA